MDRRPGRPRVLRSPNWKRSKRSAYNKQYREKKNYEDWHADDDDTDHELEYDPVFVKAARLDVATPDRGSVAGGDGDNRTEQSSNSSSNSDDSRVNTRSAEGAGSNSDDHSIRGNDVNYQLLNAVPVPNDDDDNFEENDLDLAILIRGLDMEDDLPDFLRKHKVRNNLSHRAVTEMLQYFVHKGNILLKIFPNYTVIANVRVIGDQCAISVALYIIF